ncbi:hypothetical protein ACROYT_G018081 [Oculina patagonica]
MANSSSTQNATGNSSAAQEQIGSMGFYGTNEFETIIVVLLSFVIVFGFLGNLTVIGTIFQRQRNLKTSSNYLIMNIAIADLLVAVVVAPLRFVEMYHGWPLGEFLCHFLAPLQDVIVCISVVTHTVIALERYRGIVQPFKEKLSIRRTKQAIGVIWLACYIASGLPIALIVQETVIEGVSACGVEWPSHIFLQVYVVYLAVVFVIVPLVIQTYTYSYIVKVVNTDVMAGTDDSTAIQLDSSDLDTHAHRKLTQSRARVVKTLILLVVAFHLCSIPRVFTMLLWEFGNFENNLSFQYAYTITLIIYYLKHVINPFIIFATSAEFRGSCC